MRKGRSSIGMLMMKKKDEIYSGTCKKEIIGDITTANTPLNFRLKSQIFLFPICSLFYVTN